MRTSPVLLCLAAFLAASRAAPAEDPPKGAEGARIVWPDVLVLGDLAVSRDGKWLAGKTTDGHRLLPAPGGAPIPLDLGAVELTGGYHCAFTADSKWLLVTGNSQGAVTGNTKPDLTQSLFAFPVDAPARRKTYQVPLSEKPLPKKVRQLMPSGTSIKQLAGAISTMVPLDGTRMLCDRTMADPEIRDASSGAKSVVPASLDDSYSCGVSTDGKTSALLTDGALEIRDVRSNRLLKSMKLPPEPKRSRSKPQFTRDGSAVIVAASTPVAGPDRVDDFSFECWSVAEGTRTWTAPLGQARLLSDVATSSACALACGDSTLYVVDLRDGKPVKVQAPTRVLSAHPTAEGDALWVAASAGGIHRVPLPAAAAR